MSIERVIALIDMDCFYVQCEQRLCPHLWSHPCAVAQYNSWKGGGLIAVNYEARSHGIKRGMRGNDSTNMCPELHIFSVPEVRGKADLTRYRDASAEVFEAINQLVQNLNPDIIVEKASVDEAFIDLTKHIDQMVESLHPLPQLDDLSDTKLELSEDIDLKQWLDILRDNELFNANEIRLCLGAVVVQQIRREILSKTEFKCSAGISHNKMLAKLCCALNKPNAQTILPKEGVDQLFRRTDINKVRSLGGKLGAQVKQLFGINNMFELKCLEFNQLSKHFETKTCKWLKEMANGLDDEPVSNRQLSKSLGCGKNFPGKTALKTTEDIKHWIKQLSEELVERMTRDRQTNKRTPKLLVVGFHSEKEHNSRSLQLDQWSDSGKLVEQVMKQVFNKIKFDPIVNLSIAASKFVDECDDPSYNTNKLDNYFSKINKNELRINEISSNCGESSKRLKICATNTKTLKDFWNCSTSKAENRLNNTSDCESDVQVIETNICNNMSKNTSNNMSNVMDIRVDTNETLDFNPINDKKPIKRGFFFRKLMKLRAEERESRLNK